MASTNKTANYNLSQFIGTDKPAWLGDYNQDMSKIDTQMKSNNDLATSASGTATSASTALGDISKLETTTKTSAVAAINEVNTEAETAQTSANQAQTVANQAKTSVSNLQTKFNLNTVVDNITWNTNIGNIIASPTIKCVHNADGSIGKLYGHLYLNNSAGSNNIVLTSSDTGLRPKTNINIGGNVFRAILRSDTGTTGFTDARFTINTNGTITMTLNNNQVYSNNSLYFFACLLFMDNFGD